MKTLIAASTAIFFCMTGASVSAAQITVAQALQLKEKAGSGAFAARAEWNAFTYYLQGLAEGAAAYQIGLTTNDQKTLFCPHRTKSFSSDEMFEFLSAAARTSPGRPAAVVILEGYSEKYPCTE